ncbi:DNA cytosine methyltransferase [Streptomyces diacarni]|uniref:Cytosine-specific methyltransferase n=1 Tax=Streptomyces diacarni TaxID=2800381 RepID=A0A367F1F5_9ACTN|nr:DNA cytosine methyltransferase [Streptomyces diacarni]
MNDLVPNPIKVVDLFAGCGGFTQGFTSFRPDGHRSGAFRTVAAVEHDRAAASTYAANFGGNDGHGHHVQAGDIQEWRPGELGIHADVVLGGPPCQGFSTLGLEDANDPRNQLWREYVRVVNEVQPKIFVIENVEGFLRSPEFAALHAATEKPDGPLRQYELVEHAVLNSADYGAPQARRRAIVIGVHRDEHALKGLTYPARSHARTPSGSDGTAPWIGVGPSVFAKTLLPTESTQLPVRTCNPLGDHELPGYYTTPELHIGRQPTEHSLARYKAIPPGGNRHDLPDHLSTPKWIAHRTGSHDVMGRMYWDRPSVTIRTEFYKPEKGRYLHPFAWRPITHYEAALIQGFPDTFRWCGSKIDIGRQIGNAVPVQLAHALAGAIYAALRDGPVQLRF